MPTDPAMTSDVLTAIAARALDVYAEPVEICDAEGRLLYVNPAFERRTGFSAAEALGHRADDLLDCPRLPEILEVVRQGRAWRGSVVSRPRRGPALFCDLVVTPLLDPDGSLTHLVCVRRPLVSSDLDGCSPMGQLATGIAHGVNNPLSYVLANLTFLEREIDALGPSLPPPRAAALQDLVADVADGAHRIRDIVRDLQQFVPVDAAQEPVDVEDALDLAVQRTERDVRPRARLQRLRGGVPPVRGDAERLADAFAALLVNAAQAIPPGAQGHVITVATLVHDGVVRVEIRDTGEGVSVRDLDRVFEPFYTTRAQATGLGLPRVRSVIAAMGGRVGFETGEGRGTTVCVELPAVAPAAPPPARDLRRRRVLVVDDEPLVARALVRVLSGHQVEVCHGGREAVERLGADPFDAVVCDLMMPHTSGMAVYRQAVAARPELADRFVFVTGGAYTPEARRFLDALAHPAVEKPFTPDAILDAVQRALDGAPAA